LAPLDKQLVVQSAANVLCLELILSEICVGSEAEASTAPSLAGCCVELLDPLEVMLTATTIHIKFACVNRLKSCSPEAHGNGLQFVGLHHVQYGVLLVTHKTLNRWRSSTLLSCCK